MKIYRETCVAGRTIMQSLKASTRIKSKKGEKRNPKTNPTSEAVRKINLKNAIKDLTIKINHNFEPEDYHLTLTYAVAPTQEAAKKHLNNFLRNLRNHCKKENINFKRIAVTEFENARIHHHIVCTGIDISVIKKYWSNGWVNVKLLDETGNYVKLAEYLVKETEKTFRKEGNVFRRRYSASRNIITPAVKKETVSERELHKEIKPLKGYYIDQDSVKRYEHAILKVECLEYIQVSLTETPRLKRWSKGSVVKQIERYNDHEEQQELKLYDYRGGEQ